MKIHELATKTGLTAPTIRFYEKQGLLSSHYVQREANNYRDYSQEAVELLCILKKFQAAGFTLTEFKSLVQAYDANELPIQKVIELLYQKMDEIDRKKGELTQIQEYITRMIAHKVALMDGEEKRMFERSANH